MQDLKKTTVVIESLSNNTTNVLFQRIPAYFKKSYMVWGLLNCCLQNSSDLFHKINDITSVGCKLQALYFSKPWSADYHNRVLHFMGSGRVKSSISNMFPHFKFQFFNLVYMLSSTD